jgi:hypothetical protein
MKSILQILRWTNWWWIDRIKIKKDGWIDFEEGNIFSEEKDGFCFLRRLYFVGRDTRWFCDSRRSTVHIASNRVDLECF